MIVGVLTTCHTQYTWDSRIYVCLFNRTTLQVFVTYLTGVLYVHPLWFYKHQHDNRVRSKLFVAFLYTWVRASWIEFNNFPTRCDLFSLLHFCRQRYMFRVLTPIIRSWYSCNYSFWYWLTGDSRSVIQYQKLYLHVQAPDDGCQHPKHVELPTEM